MTDKQKVLLGFIDCSNHYMKCFDDGEKNRKSCFVDLLFDARMMAGRKVNTGKNDPKHMGLFNRDEWDEKDEDYRFLSQTRFVGISLYLFLLDMIGLVFEDITYPHDLQENENGIRKALKQFALDLSKKDRNTIISLRNCLAHNYGLIAKPDNHDPINNWNHKFTLLNYPEETVPMITYPSIEWDGNYNTRKSFGSTKINRPKLIQFVEDIVLLIEEKLKKEEIELALSGVEELKARFTTL